MIRTVRIFLVSLCFVAGLAEARDTKHMVSIQDALSSIEAQSVLSESIALYWGEQSYPMPLRLHGEWVANRKTNATNKSDLGSCYWAFLSAVKSLQKRAYEEGGNAVVNIRSYYKKRSYSSTDVYECHAGDLVTGVALKGEVVTLP